ncbi:MAG: peptidyl-prolyl cis-trans isomerase [Planctomycetia bacterium]|nr:peptidyl-prolyl cis-trans isomerase [Planctomycetia bacterium]
MKTSQRWIMCGCIMLLGCHGAPSLVAQGKADLLFPPAGSLPQGTGNPPARTANAPAMQQPSGAIQQTSNTLPKGTVKSRVIARVNGSPILEEEIISATNMMMNEAKKRIAQQYWAQLERELSQKALDDLVTEEAIIQDAAIKIPPPAMKNIQEVGNKEFDKIMRRDKEVVKLKTEDEIKEYFNNQGKSIDLMRRQFVRSFIATQWIRELCRDKSDTETTRERLLEYYRANPNEFLKKERVVWQHIYIDVDRYSSVQAARKVAETAWQLLRNAKTDKEFNDIVEKYADGISKARSGSGEGNFRGDIRPTELERFVFDQPTGGQGPLVETSRGYHLFRVIEHTPEEMISFEKVCNDLKRKMEDRIYQAEFTRLSKQIKEKAYIEMLDKNQ